MLGEKEWKYIAQQICPAHRTIFSQLLKINLLPETYGFSGSTKIYLIEFNNNNNKVQNMFTIEPPDKVLFFLLLTWNIFDMLF